MAGNAEGKRRGMGRENVEEPVMNPSERITMQKFKNKKPPTLDGVGDHMDAGK